MGREELKERLSRLGSIGMSEAIYLLQSLVKEGLGGLTAAELLELGEELAAEWRETFKLYQSLRETCGVRIGE